jgi:hypothetical protein
MERNKKTTSLEICPCKAQIDQEHQKICNISHKKQQKQALLEMMNNAIDCSMTSHNNITAASLDCKRSK